MTSIDLHRTASPVNSMRRIPAVLKPRTRRIRSTYCGVSYLNGLLCYLNGLFTDE
jgi:hypothetical protein